MPPSPPAEDKEYDDLRIAYELGTLMRSSDVKVTEIDAKEGRKFTRFGRAYVRYTFNQLKEVTVHVLAVAFSTNADVITNIINNNYNRKKFKNGDDILEDDEIRMEDLELLVSLEDWIARRRYGTRAKEEEEEEEEKRYMPTPPPGFDGTQIPLPMEPTPAGGAPLPSPASSAAATHTKKKKSRRSKKQNKATNVQADAESKEKDGGNEDKSASKKRKYRDLEPSEERVQERLAKVKKVASTTGPATSSSTPTTASSKANKSKHVPVASSSSTTTTTTHKKADISSPKKAKTPANIQPDVPRPFSDKESLKLMDNFFKDAGPYMPDYLDQLLVDKFGPQELSYLKRQCVTKEKMMEELKDVDIKIFRGRPVRLSTFTDAVVKAKEAAWKTLEKELEKGLCSMR